MKIVKNVEVIERVTLDITKNIKDGEDLCEAIEYGINYLTIEGYTYKSHWSYKLGNEKDTHFVFIGENIR